MRRPFCCAAMVCLLLIGPAGAPAREQPSPLGEPSSPMVMFTFELEAGYPEFVSAYRANPLGASPYYIAPWLGVLGMSNDGAFHALHMQQRPIGHVYRMMSDSRRDLAPDPFAAIPAVDLVSALDWDAADCAFLYDEDDCLLVTTFVPSEVLGGSSPDLAVLDTSGYLTAVVPANNYTSLFWTLSADRTEGVSLYYERFGEARQQWYELRTSGNYPVFGPGRHPSFPFDTPHVRWLVISGQAVNDELVPILRRAFESHTSFLSGSVAWTSGIGAAHDVLQMPPILLYQTYSVTLEPEFSTQLMEPQELTWAIEQWSSVLVGMYVVEDGNIQLVFFRGN